MHQPTITFIGAGNMATSLMGGLINDNYPANKITATDPSQAKLDNLREKLNINTNANNTEGAKTAEIIVFAVKPKPLKTVVDELKLIIQAQKPLLISIAAGIPETHIRNWLGFDTAIVRCMPNTPCLLGVGATGLYANQFTDQTQRDQAESIMRAVGVSLWVDQEAQMDVVTALSGCGPAYFFYVMEAMQQAAIKLGLPANTASLLTTQTALGSARLALESDEAPAELRKRVTSPGGTTEAAVNVFTEQQLKSIFDAALTAASDRAKELADVMK